MDGENCMNELSNLIEHSDELTMQAIIAKQHQTDIANFSARACSQYLRQVRDHYKKTKNRLFLDAGVAIWRQSKFHKQTDTYINNAIGWIFRDLCFDFDYAIEDQLKIANQIITMTAQENYSPYENTVWRILDALEKSKISNKAEVMLSYIKKLDHTKLSRTPFQAANDRELASDQERWFSHYSKLTHKLHLYEECIDISTKFVHAFTKFHYNNDIWAQRRIALCYMELGNVEKAKDMLQQTLKKFDNTNIYAALMEVAIREQDVVLAKSYAANAILNRAGEMHHKVKVLQSLAVLFEADEPKLAYAHYALLHSVRKKQAWPVLPHVVEKINAYEKEELPLLDQRALKKYWEELAATLYPTYEGEIAVIFGNEESGKIKMNDEEYYFSLRKNKQLKKNELQLGRKVTFRIKESFDYKKQRDSYEAIAMKLKKY